MYSKHFDWRLTDPEQIRTAFAVFPIIISWPDMDETHIEQGSLFQLVAIR